MIFQQLLKDGFRLFRVQKYNDNCKNHKGYYIAEHSGKQFVLFAGTYDTKEIANSHIDKICKVNSKVMNVTDLITK